MKHLQFMARFVMIERGDGYADLSDRKIEDFINDSKQDDGIGNLDFGNEPEAKATLKTLNVFYEIFKDDPMLDAASGIKELSVEYFVISIYLLIRHLSKYYVIDEKTKPIIRAFVYDVHASWRSYDEAVDTDLLAFSNRRQQGGTDLEARDIILRQLFFAHLKSNGLQIIVKDEKRSFTELERIIVYRKGKGLCQQCLKDEKPEKEAKVSWSEYQTDHVLPHARGGKTILENAQLLCSYHNQSKGDLIGESE